MALHFTTQYGPMVLWLLLARNKKILCRRGLDIESTLDRCLINEKIDTSLEKFHQISSHVLRSFIPCPFSDFSWDSVLILSLYVFYILSVVLSDHAPSIKRGCLQCCRGLEKEESQALTSNDNNEKENSFTEEGGRSPKRNFLHCSHRRLPKWQLLV